MTSAENKKKQKNPIVLFILISYGVNSVFQTLQ